MTIINRLSKVIGPMISSGTLNQDFISKSQKLFLELGLTHFTDGMGTLSPFVVRSLRKLERLVRKEMDNISALEIVLPTLTQFKLFEISGRMNLPDTFKLQKGNAISYVLSPTNEEAVTSLLASVKTLTHSQLPCRLYQISKKFRDERRAKSGLLRSKEFLMKDLYCFNASMEYNEESYEEIVNKYHSFFQMLKLPYVCAHGSVGDIGGLCSHEFHILTNAGEDKIILCQDCGHNENSNCNDSDIEGICKKCQSKNIKIMNGIEAGHTFNLGTRYSDPFKATYKNSNGEHKLLHMSCFGLGLTRILAASVEVLCTSEEIKWPVMLAPYLVCILPPKAGSKEEKKFGVELELIYQNLNKHLKGEVIIDDRTSLSIGSRLQSIRKLGFPIVVIFGKSILQNPPLVEIQDQNSGSKNFVQILDVTQYVLNRLMDGTEDELLKKEREVLM